MKTQICVILDEDELYVSRLAHYMKTINTLPFEAAPFTDPDRLLSFCEGKQVLCFVTGRSDWPVYYEKIHPVMCFVLADPGSTAIQPGGEAFDDTQQLNGTDDRVDTKIKADRDGQDETGRKVVYLDRYQPADTLVSAMLERIASRSLQPGRSLPPRREYKRDSPAGAEYAEYEPLRVSAVYSPIGRCGKTCFAVALGEALSLRHRVLYLNMEEYSGFAAVNTGGREYHSPADLSDLLYFSRQSDGNLIYKLSSMVRTWNNLDYIEPAFSSGDLKEAGAGEWSRLLGMLLDLGEYDRIVLDLGSQSGDALQLLRICDQIYVPVLDDLFSRAKLRQFLSNLEAMGASDLTKRMMKLHLPVWQEENMTGDFPRQLLRGKYMQYARRLIMREEVDTDD